MGVFLHLWGTGWCMRMGYKPCVWRVVADERIWCLPCDAESDFQQPLRLAGIGTGRWPHGLLIFCFFFPLCLY